MMWSPKVIRKSRLMWRLTPKKNEHNSRIPHDHGFLLLQYFTEKSHFFAIQTDTWQHSCLFLLILRLCRLCLWRRRCIADMHRSKHSGGKATTKSRCLALLAYQTLINIFPKLSPYTLSLGSISVVVSICSIIAGPLISNSNGILSLE